MKDLKSTSTLLDKVLYALSIALDVATVCMIVGVVIIAAGLLFDIDPRFLGTGFEQADLGFLTVHVAKDYMPPMDHILLQIGAMLLMAFFCLLSARAIAKSFRTILAAMKSGEPFQESVSTQLGKIARHTIVLGIKVNLANIVNHVLIVKVFSLSQLLISDKVEKVQFLFSFDLSFLLVAGAFLLLSHVFRYGTGLQQLSDETL